MAFVNSSDIDIHGDAHNVVYGVQDNRHTTNYIGDPNRPLEQLAARAAPNAFFDSEQRFPPPNCHPGTREEILQSLSQWVEGKSKATVLVSWLNGPAGVGKSAIAQSLAEKYASTRLAASFFFSRNDSSRDKLDPFVSTIAYQLAMSESLRHVLGPLISAVIREHPSILHSSYEIQFKKLIVEPCCKAFTETGGNLSNLIIIDGLDECLDIQSQERLLAMIRAATTDPKKPFPFIILICSRPEPRIRDSFDHPRFRAVLGGIKIGESYETNRDLETYLRYQFTEIRKRHYRNMRKTSETWPGEDAIHLLVQRASGQFIYVTTVIKFVGSDDGFPLERLETILYTPAEDIPDSPYPDLDLLYRQILFPCPNRDKVLQVLRLLATKHHDPGSLSGLGLRYEDIHWKSSWAIEQLLQLRQGEVGSLLFRLHSVLHIPEDEEELILILHASFTEFLHDSRRSLHYHVKPYSPAEYGDIVAQLLLRHIAVTRSLYPNPIQLHPPLFEDTLPLWAAHVRATSRSPTSGEEKLRIIAYLLWASYCRQSGSLSSDLVAALDDFDPYSYFALLFNRCLILLSKCNVSRGDRNYWHRNSQKDAAVSIATELDGALESFEKFVAYAKTPGNFAIPRKFIHKSESFLRGFTVGFRPAALGPKSLKHWLYLIMLLRVLLVPYRYHMKKTILAMLIRPLENEWTTLLASPVPLLAPEGKSVDNVNLTSLRLSNWVLFRASQEDSMTWYERFEFLDPAVLQRELTMDSLGSITWSFNLVKLWQLYRLKSAFAKDRKLLKTAVQSDDHTPQQRESIVEPIPSGSGQIATTEIPEMAVSTQEAASTSHAKGRTTRHTSSLDLSRRRAMIFDDSFTQQLSHSVSAQ